jgi:hypothetical protein
MLPGVNRTPCVVSRHLSRVASELDRFGGARQQRPGARGLTRKWFVMIGIMISFQDCLLLDASRLAKVPGLNVDPPNVFLGLRCLRGGAPLPPRVNPATASNAKNAQRVTQTLA